VTATLPDGMEYKNLDVACIDAAAGVWGSEYPEQHGVRNLIVAVTGVRDEVGDIICPGAFTKTLDRLTPKACLGHDWNRAVGYPEDIKELLPGDPRLPKTDRFNRPWPKKAGALFARTRYHLDTTDGERAYKDAVFFGPRLATSIGYVVPKDEQGKPKFYKAIDPDTGLLTRFLPELDLFEYSQVLHGAHLLAGGLKDAKPTRLERKQRPDMELKLRLVRDASYWGMPLGTPIRPGMKPQGPKARRIAAAGQQADENAGAVEIDAANLRVKPTATGKQEGDAAIEAAYSETRGLLNQLGDSNPNLDSDDPVDPFDNSTFVVVDQDNINNGELFNPLDILVANAVPPIEVEEDLRNADWDDSRLGDAADRQDEIDSYIADVADAYREKYNAELVRQNDTGDGEVAESSAEDTEVQAPDAGMDTPGVADTRPPLAEESVSAPNGEGDGNGLRGYAIPPSPAEEPEAPQPVGSKPTEQEWQAAQEEMRAAGIESEAVPSTGVVLAEPSEQSAAEPGNIPEGSAPAPAAGEGVGRFPDGTKPGPKLIAALGNAIWVTGQRIKESDGEDATPSDGWLVRGNETTVFQLRKKDVAKIPLGVTAQKGARGSYLLTDEGARLMAPYLPNGGQREGASADGVTPAEALPDTGIDDVAPSTEVVPEQPSGQSTVEPGLAPEGEPGEPLGEAGPPLAAPIEGDGDGPLVEDIDQAQAEAINQDATEETETVTGDEIADADEIIDAGFGVTEAPDGEFEVEPDVADRQDRVAALLLQSEAGSLDLASAGDTQLRGTRADIVDELRLQQHLERRRSGEQAVTRQQAEQQEADDLIPQEADDEPGDTGPKPRPGVAGAAEDLADALDDGDQARIDAATARLRASLNRSRSDSEVVAELRTLIGGLDPAALRDAAQRLRDEQRAKRNEGARRRRAARRFERERLRALLGQVEAEMRNRNLDYDPIPDDDGDVTVQLDSTPPAAWISKTRRFDWANSSDRVDTLTGSGYTATITTHVKPDGTLKPSEYQWSALSDDGSVLATGKGTSADPDAARATVEIALDTQRRLGLIPVDAQIPQGSVPEHTSATPLSDVVGAIEQMRARLADGRTLNPITGQPDPLADGFTPLPVPERSRFTDAAEVRKYLEVNGPKTREGNDNLVTLYRWDTAKMTPGGAFVIIDNLQGKPQLLHTVSGGSFNPPMIAGNLGRADMLRYATIVESLPDSNGRTVDWNLRHGPLMDNMQQLSFAEGDGVRALQEAAVNRLTREKIHAGQFTHKLVLRDITSVDGVTNPSRKQYVQDQHRTLAQLINVARGKPDTYDKKTLEIASGARTLAAMGAPDAAAVMLTRRAADIREQYGNDAHSRGIAVLEALATGYLGMFSPVRSHGERVGAIKAGERLFLSGDNEGDPPRGFRALAPLRRDTYSLDRITSVIDEKTGDQKILRVSTAEFRIEDNEEIRYGYNPLSAALSGGQGAFAVAGPGEEPPATQDDLKARQFDDASVIPQDVLDAAAEALPESARETAVRRATPTDGVRPPRRRSPAAPKRTAPPAAAPEPVAGEQHLAEAQGRIDGAFLGMPFSYGDKPERGSFEDLGAVREHLVALETGVNDPRVASSARAVLTHLDSGSMKLSPGGVFLVGKDGYVTHASSSQRVWPPTGKGSTLDDLGAGGYRYSQAASMRVARALESGVFDGEQIDWSGDGLTAVRQTSEISKRNGKFHPLQTAQRAAYRDGVLDTAKPGKSDVAMFRGMADQLDLTGPNPEAFDGAVLGKATEYSPYSGYVADSKKNADLAARVEAELRLTGSLARTAPLDAVRRLTRLADELDGQGIEMRLKPGSGQYGAPQEPKKTLTPSEDLRAAAKMITDVYDPDKISESSRFRRAGMVGRVEIIKPKITMGRTWEDPNGVAARRLESAIRQSGGITFYRDADGHLHATFTASETGTTVDITDDMVQVGGGQTGAIKLAPDGRLTLSYISANRLIVIEASPRGWKFTPDTPENGDGDTDTSGPEIESPQVDEGAPEDIEAGTAEAGTSEDDNEE